MSSAQDPYARPGASEQSARSFKIWSKMTSTVRRAGGVSLRARKLTLPARLSRQMRKLFGTKSLYDTTQGKAVMNYRTPNCVSAGLPARSLRGRLSFRVIPGYPVLRVVRCVSFQCSVFSTRYSLLGTGHSVLDSRLAGPSPALCNCRSMHRLAVSAPLVQIAPLAGSC